MEIEYQPCIRRASNIFPTSRNTHTRSELVELLIPLEGAHPEVLERIKGADITRDQTILMARLWLNYEIAFIDGQLEREIGAQEIECRVK